MKKILIAVLIAAVGLVFFYRAKNENQNELSTVTDEIEVEQEETSVFPVKKAPPVTSVTEQVDTDNPEATAEPVQISEEVVVLQRQLQDLSRCLKVTTTPLTADDGMTMASLGMALRESLGASISEQEVWHSADIITPQGERRRIVVEHSGGDSGHGSTVQYFKVTSEEILHEIPLSDEQSLNPNDAFVNSLEAQGQVETRSASRQLFYNGALIQILEKDGKLQSYEVRSKDKTFICKNDQSCLCE